MTMTIRAVYEGGVLRPVRPLALDESESVEVTVTKTKPSGQALRPPTSQEEDYARRMNAAKTLDEMYAVMATAPSLPEGYDLSRALKANRQATCERVLFPELEERSNP